MGVGVVYVGGGVGWGRRAGGGSAAGAANTPRALLRVHPHWQQ